MEAKPTKETSPILHSIDMRIFYDTYDSRPHATFEKGVAADYEARKMTSLRNLFIVAGTAREDPMLFMEQIVIFLIYLVGFLPFYTLQSRYIRFQSQQHRQKTLNNLLEQEANIRKFTLIVTGLVTFLLSLYTGKMVARWWTIRTKGIGVMKATTSDLQLYISHFVTDDVVVLKAIRRYSRASLKLIFLWRRNQLKDDRVVRRELVGEHCDEPHMKDTDEVGDCLSNCEVNQLRNWNSNLHESIWTWHVQIVEMLYREGKIPNDQLLVLLLEKISEARQAVQLIVTYVTVKFPMQYVHLLCFAVKLHNILCAFLMGVLSSTALKNRDLIILAQLAGRALLLPFIFNALLLINSDLADPFNGSASDFPKDKYDKSFENDAQTFLDAKKHLPRWITDLKRPYKQI